MDISVDIKPNIYYKFGEVTSLSVRLKPSTRQGVLERYAFQFSSGAVSTRLSVPSNIEWAHNPIIRANRTYQVAIIGNYATYKEFLNTDGIPTSEIWYTSLDGNVVEPYSKTVFGATYESNDYESGKGIMIFAGEVTKIGTDAFRGKTTLTSVMIPKSVVEIGVYAFYNCSSLHNVNIPNGVTSIGTYAFAETAVASIVIPNSVTTMGTHTFKKCASLKAIVFSDALTSIGNYTCHDCDALESVVIPDSVTSIGNSAFRSCGNLTSIVLSDNLTTIDAFAFQSCAKLANLELPSTLDAIGNNAFQGCNAITSINIPDMITTIGDEAFYYCYKLTSVTFEGTTPPTLGTRVFAVTPTSLQLRVPSSAVEVYKAAYPDYADKIVGY